MTLGEVERGGRREAWVGGGRRPESDWAPGERTKGAELKGEIEMVLVLDGLVTMMVEVAKRA